MTKADEMIHALVLRLLREGVCVAAVAEALMAEKVKLMQTDEYMQAVHDSKRSPI